jgi:arsenate reductase-like glutaredoxin family protein
MITRNTVAAQLRDYLQHPITRAALVDWAERAMMEEEFR